MHPTPTQAEREQAWRDLARISLAGGNLNRSTTPSCSRMGGKHWSAKNDRIRPAVRQPASISRRALRGRTPGASTESEEGEMRINVYSQELTSEVILIEKESNTGLVYSAAQLILHSSDRLHHPPHDDDRSAVTFWMPKSKDRREEMAQAFESIATLFRTASPETGLD